MCGILGIRSLRSARIQPQRARHGLDVLRHRGPNDEGLVAFDAAGAFVAIGGRDTPPEAFDLDSAYRATREDDRFEQFEATVVLGSRRLAVQDLSAAGHQPMCDNGGALWIAFNGEIYNFLALRAELEAHGHKFHSHTDTEVVLHAYEEWGEDCFHRFNGMWGLALWDTRDRRLIVSRDRFGVKPLLYSVTPEAFVFASEAKALFATGLVQPRANDELVLQYLAYGFVDHTNATVFTGVESLPPGHLLVLEEGDTTPRVRRWYELPLADRRDDHPVDDFGAMLEDAVAHRLVSDVAVGTCLSGGLDSSSIAALVDRLMRRRGAKLGTLDVQKVFSARHPGSSHDEGPFIDAVVAATSAEPHVVVPTAEGLARDLEALVWHQDAPFASTSIYAQWEVYRLVTENGVTVTLDGQGGDETVGGYPTHRTALLLELMRTGRLSAWLREAGADASGRALTRIAAASLQSALRLRLPDTLRARALDRRAPRFSPSWLEWDPVHPASVYDHGRSIRDAFVSQLYLDLTVGLPSLLRYADRNSMAHSVEARLPFLDYRLVELAFTLPNDSRVQRTETKRILRDAMRGLVPDTVLVRRDKIAFSTPEAEWLRGPLTPLVDDVLTSTRFRARPWLNHTKVDETLQQFRRGNPATTPQVWRLLNLELWLRLLVEAPARAGAPSAATPA